LLFFEKNGFFSSTFGDFCTYEKNSSFIYQLELLFLYFDVFSLLEKPAFFPDFKGFGKSNFFL
jgi:hypothetical protein